MSAAETRTGVEPIAALEARLRAICRSLGSAAVAFSGGVDSALVLRVCHDELGERAVAVTGRSDSFAPEEEADAARICAEIGCRQILVETEEITLKGYIDNPPERCAVCKTELFRKMREVVAREGLSVIVDGTNLDDAQDPARTGTVAADRQGVRSPLREAGLRKADVRALARALGVSAWDKPAMACLSSRIPFGERITPEKLAQVAAAESALRRLDLGALRVRHHGTVARVEIDPALLAEALRPEKRAAIVAGVKAAGFTYVTIDLEGLRSGSMNEALVTIGRRKR